MKKFKYRLETKINVVLGLIIATCAVAIVMTAVRLLELFDTSSRYPALDIAIILAALSIIAVAVYTLVASSYVIEDKFVINIGLFSQSVSPRDIISVFKRSKDDTLWIAYYYKGEFTRMRIYVASSQIDSFVDSIKAINGELVYEIKSDETEGKE